MVDYVVSLEVVSKEGGVMRMELVDKEPDKSWLSIVGVVRYKSWVLVVNGPFVLGGFDTDRNVLVAANSDHWDELPFTLRETLGDVVAENVISPTLKIDRPRHWHRKVEPEP